MSGVGILEVKKRWKKMKRQHCCEEEQAEMVEEVKEEGKRRDLHLISEEQLSTMASSPSDR